MKNQNLSAKEFTTLVNGAKVEINGIFSNPFVVVNILNKAAKGDYSKVANVEGITTDNLRKVANEVKKLHTGRYAFDLSIFQKDDLGRFYSGTTKVENLPIDILSDITNGQIVTDNKGRQIVCDSEKGFVVLMPISLTIKAVFNAFAKAAKIELSKAEKAEKAAKIDAKKALRNAKATLKGIIKDYNDGRINEMDFVEKAKAAKATINELEKAA